MPNESRVFCPIARSVTCYEIATQTPNFLASGCRRWSCPTCGPVKRAALAIRITHAKPSRMITLTCRHEVSPEHQLQRMRKLFQRFTARARKTFGEFEYIRILEQCVDGYPHFHLLCRTGFIPHAWLKQEWSKVLGAEIVDIRKAHGRSVGYVAKYITKAFSNNAMRLTVGQRIGTSHRFYQDTEDQTQILTNFEHHNEHPIPFAHTHYTRTLTLHPRRFGLYWIQERRDGDDLPPEFGGGTGPDSTPFDPPKSTLHQDGF